MSRTTLTGWTLFSLLACSVVLQTVAYPQAASSQIAAQYRPPSVPLRSGAAVAGASDFQPSPRYDEDDRKFAEKPNALKKVALDDIDEDIQTNQISDNGFSWTNMLGTLMTMFFNNAANAGPNKSDDIDTSSSGGLAPSPWANVISVGKQSIHEKSFANSELNERKCIV